MTAIFVHGWRLKYTDFMNWSDTSYKRLWHQGFRGKFYAFRWPTYSADNTVFRNNSFDNWQDQHAPVPPGCFTYDASEYRAWLCGPALASWVNSLPHPSTKRNLFAHSMGNVISGAALRAGMVVENYALCNAAMAAMAYDPNPALRNKPNKNDPLDKIWVAFEPKMTPDTDPLATIREAYGIQNKFKEGSKKGYLRYPSYNSMSSGAQLSYSKEKQGSGHRHENPETPLILVLHKIGPSEPTLYVKQKRWKLPLDGSPRIIALDSEKGEGAHQIEFRLWSDTHIRELPGNNAYTAFDWRFEARVPGGGLAWDRSDASFEAPESGYSETIRYAYAATMPREEWKRMRYGRYFVKFADGTYGRIQFDIDGGSDRSPLYMQSWLSLKPGSRNLGDENMTIKVLDSEEPQQ